MATGAPGRTNRGTIPAIIAVASLILAISVFLPWYTADVAPPFTPEATSGWDATMLARITFAMGIITLLSSALIWLDLRGFLPVDADIVRALAWTCLVLTIGATALVAWRLVRPPGPAEFLARDVGLFIAQAAAIVALVASIGAVRPRNP
jgi:Na+/H+ antiporter NhaA